MLRYFRWEKSWNGKWIPVCYANKPVKPLENGGLTHGEIFTIPNECYDDDGEPNFGKLKNYYPIPT